MLKGMRDMMGRLPDCLMCLGGGEDLLYEKTAMRDMMGRLLDCLMYLGWGDDLLYAKGPAGSYPLRGSGYPTVKVVTPFVIVVTPIHRNYCFAGSKKLEQHQNFMLAFLS